MKNIRNYIHHNPAFETAEVEPAPGLWGGLRSLLPYYMNRHFRPILSFSLDVLALFLAFVGAYVILALTVWDRPFSWDRWVAESGQETLIVMTAQLATMFFLGGYDFSHRVFLARRLSRRIMGLLIGTIIGIFVMVFVLQVQDIHRLATLFEVAIAVPAFALTSILVRRISLSLGKRSVALVITETEAGQELVRDLLAIAQPQYHEVITTTADEYERNPSQFDEYLANCDCCVFDVADGKTDSFRLKHAIHMQAPKSLTASIDEFYSRVTGHVHQAGTETHGVSAAFNNPNLCSLQFRITQRARDFVISLIGLILTAPLWPFIALAIKLDSKGPVFFKQERVGQFKQPFTCIKFRTMSDGADAGTWSTPGDPRITRVGNFLRQSRLDELPQLLNVLRGDMNIVGPRPIREKFAQKFAVEIPSYHLRFIVKPGLTGWAQLRYKYPLSDDDQLQKFRYDMFYLSQVSHDFDLGIMIGTLKTMLRRSGV